ncbi:MAG: flagellar motor switch protein FliN [Robiginitomaculum sp.]|nr:MAG: flagellar motor switch protein FliN [Robiginitomaculum sp.]
MSDEETKLDLPEFDGADAAQETPDPAAGASPEAPPAAAMAEDETKIAADLAPVFDVPVNISAVLGKTKLDVNQLLQLSAGSVLELDRKVGEAIDIYVNSRLVARGEVVVIDERLGVTMTEIIKADDAG